MYGAPGTGKTMAAQVVANELGLPLYRVDVSQIFSKYIGETQKNLGVIFDEAKKANLILFFDEADALFAKRTEVGDSNDRYANSETAYLLQKIEEHNGMTILATNLYHNFDSAFVRRITYVVRIDSPDEETRLRLWQNTLPKTMGFGADVDFEFLAERFELSGSNIKSILHTAAYMAGSEDRMITMRDMIISLRYELEKLGRIIDSSDFANYGVYLEE
ncbi:MAG: ATP-binding protein [Lachnospiraceae bacterium]|nr:ATP-binding protein [Lachnospiraceae bacterium]